MPSYKVDPEAVSPVPYFVRLFVSIFEDIEETEPVMERRWKNYDGYHFVSRVVKPKELNQSIDPVTHFKKNLKYALCVPVHLIHSLPDLSSFLCKAFSIEDEQNYTVILDDDTLIFDIRTLHENDKIKLVRKNKLIKISQMAEKMRKCEKLISEFSTDYLDFVKKHPFILSLPKEWKNLDTVDLSHNSHADGTKSNSSDNHSAKRQPVVIPNLNQRVTVFDYNNELFYETPAFQDFLNEGTN